MRKLQKSLLSHTALVSALSSVPALLLVATAPVMLNSSTAAADETCGTYTNDVINASYSCVPITVNEATFTPAGTLIGQGTGGNGTTKKNMWSTEQTIVIGSLTSRKGYTWAGAAISTGGWDSAALDKNNTISLDSVSLYLDGISAGSYAYAGINAANGGKVWINNFTLDIANANDGDINGIIAGDPFNNKSPNGGTLENYIHVAGDYNFKAVKTSDDIHKPVTGIRAVQNNDGWDVPSGALATGVGPKATVVVDGTYSADITANYGVGVYVSGQRDETDRMPEVTLNDTNVAMHGQGIALKVGKADREVGGSGEPSEYGNDGWGAGKLTFVEGANVDLDTTDANGEAIVVSFGGSILDASRTNSFTVNAKGNALRIGNDIITDAVQSSSDLIDVKINNAYFRTNTETESLILVDQQQGDVSLAFTGADTDLKAADAGWLINVEGADSHASSVNLSVDGDGAKIAGLTNKTTASILNLTLDNYVLWTLQDKGSSPASTTSTFTHLGLSNGSQVDAFTDFTMAGNINSSAGILNLSNGLAGNTLTLKGNYVGSEGALLVVDSFLRGSGSVSDRIVNDGGTISGQTFVRVNNTDASDIGAKTEPGHGIKIVRSINGGTTTDDAFALDANAGNAYEFNGQTVVGTGAYAYALYKGANPLSSSTSDQYGESSLDNDWYLRSKLDSDDPLYQGGVPVYEAYPQLLLGLNSLPTLQQRVGNRYWNNAGNKVLSQGADVIEAYAPAEEAGVVIEENGVWGRIEGSHTKIKSKTSTSGTNYDYNTFKMQAGLDGLLSESENGKLIGGVTVHYAHGKADVYSAHGDGDIKTNGYGFGGTLTWYGENGFYVDNQAQLTWYDSDLNSSTANKSLKHGNNGFGYALSVETGKRITIDENWSVTPQAQLMYSNVRFDSFTDTFGSRVSKSRADSLQGRLGISADYQNSWLNDQGTTNRSYVYGIANLYNEFLNGTKVDVSGVSFTNKRETLWAGIGLGGSYNWNDDKYSVYGEGSVNTSLKNFGDSYNYKGTVGFRVKW